MSVDVVRLFLCVCFSYFGGTDQVQMNISPEEVVLTSSTPVSTTFTCTISSSLSFSSIYTMQIKRQRASDKSFTVLAEATNTNINPTILASAPQDIIKRATVAGGINTNTPTASTLILTMNTADVTCKDRGDYQCLLVYQATDSSVPTAEHNKTLSVYALPSDLSLSARRNGQLIQGTINDKADVNVNNVVAFTCTANIGSDNTTKIRWKRTSEIGTVDNFITYNPPQGTYTEGMATTGNTACTFSRTATMTYTVTSFDANRDNNLAFQCYVSVTPPGQNNYETQHPPSFYIHPIKVGHVDPSQQQTTKTSQQETTKTSQQEKPGCSKKVTCPELSTGLVIGLTVLVVLVIETVCVLVACCIRHMYRRKEVQNTESPFEIPNRDGFGREHFYD